MRRRTKWIGGSALVLALVGGATGMAAASGIGSDETTLTGSAHDRALAAALAKTGGGTVTEAEAGDDGAAYGVEVRLVDGRQVEVSLDADFNVTGQEVDEDGPHER